MQCGQGMEALESRTDWLRKFWRITPSSHSRFEVVQRIRSQSNCRILEIGVTPCSGRRDENEIKQAVNDGLYVTLYKRGGSEFKAEDNELIMGPGDLLLWNPGSPASFRCTSSSLGQTIVFPRDMVERRLGDRNLIGNVCPNGQDPRTALLKSHIHQIVSLPDNFDGRFSNHLLELTLELIFLCSSDLCEPRGKSPKSKKLFDRINLEIQSNLCEKDLCIAKISEVIGISVKNIQTVISSHGTTFREMVIRERLNRAAKFLRSPASKGRSMAELGCSLGFYDGAHFSNAFKRCFNMSPTKFKNLN